ncbi:hypothetical protein Sp245p_33955 (plasmid) [Azospirillum baldaniorum]|uniref:Uncharacterized protein n=1 Tax=Azospirillum baldaniorum TaxID=1064539 RepID=A0A9P1NRN5_9PROT|nr:hypothetical protein Sp245p_33955 [Azospirillum baldaniorum]CCD03240.1 protein of unknown function [Azospirillum baldaniorum]
MPIGDHRAEHLRRNSACRNTSYISKLPSRVQPPGPTFRSIRPHALHTGRRSMIGTGDSLADPECHSPVRAIRSFRRAACRVRTRATSSRQASSPAAATDAKNAASGGSDSSISHSVGLQTPSGFPAFSRSRERTARANRRSLSHSSQVRTTLAIPVSGVVIASSRFQGDSIGDWSDGRRLPR